MTHRRMYGAGAIAIAGLAGAILTINHRAADPAADARIMYLTTMEVTYHVSESDSIKLAGQVCAGDWAGVASTLLRTVSEEYRETAAARRYLVKDVTRLAAAAYCPGGAGG